MEHCLWLARNQRARKKRTGGRKKLRGKRNKGNSGIGVPINGFLLYRPSVSSAAVRNAHLIIKLRPILFSKVNWCRCTFLTRFARLLYINKQANTNHEQKLKLLCHLNPALCIMSPLIMNTLSWITIWSWSAYNIVAILLCFSSMARARARMYVCVYARILISCIRYLKILVVAAECIYVPSGKHLLQPRGI